MLFHRTIPEAPINAALPDECLVHVFDRLDNGRDRFESSMVCSRWLWLLARTGRPVAEATDGGAAANVAVQAATNAGGNSKVAGKRATERRIAAVAVLCGPKLISLQLEHFNINAVLTPRTLSALSLQCVYLENLELSHLNGLTSARLAAIGNELTRLTSMSLQSCGAVEDAGVFAFMKACTRLGRLSISMCGRIEGKGWLLLSSQPWPAMRELRLEHCLQKVLLDNDSSAEDAVLGSVASIPGLEALEVRECGGISEGVLRLLVEQATGLRELRLQGRLRCLSSEGFERVTQLNPPLLSVSLSSLPITDDSLRVLARCCPSLQELSLRDLPHVTESGIGASVLMLSALDSLRLSSTPRRATLNLVYALRPALALAGPLTLRTLSFHRISGFNDVLLPQITDSCPSLESLSLSRCSHIGENELARVLHGPLGRRLRKLDLSYTGITNKTLWDIAYKCTALQSVNLAGCWNISRDGLEKLACDRPSLREVRLPDGSCGVEDHFTKRDCKAERVRGDGTSLASQLLQNVIATAAIDLAMIAFLAFFRCHIHIVPPGSLCRCHASMMSFKACSCKAERGVQGQEKVSSIAGNPSSSK